MKSKSTAESEASKLMNNSLYGRFLQYELKYSDTQVLFDTHRSMKTVKNFCQKCEFRRPFEKLKQELKA